MIFGRQIFRGRCIPPLGDAYLIGNIDDHSRFILGAKWFSR